jgi:hypothetical protein
VLVPRAVRGTDPSEATHFGHRDPLTECSSPIPRRSYCYVTVDTGEKLVNHDKSGRKGRLTVALVKLCGLNSESLFAASLDSRKGRTSSPA